jgi:transposase
MTIRLSEAERSRLQGMTRRPRSRKQLYRAEALLALDEGRPVEEVARRFRVGVERVEQWIEGFTERRLKYLDEPKGSKPESRREGRGPGYDSEGDD